MLCVCSVARITNQVALWLHLDKLYSRYYTGDPLFAFGTGLSLTTFNFSCMPSAVESKHTATATASAPAPPEPIYRRIEYTCEVHNTGSIAGDEVLMVFHSVGQAVRKAATAIHPVPIKELVEFWRFNNIPAGGSQVMAFSMEPEVLSLTTNDGSRKVYPGEHELHFSTGGSAPDQVVTLTV